jgi:hypothetical protein
MIKQKFSQGCDCEDFNRSMDGACVRSNTCATWRGKMREIPGGCSGEYDPAYLEKHAEELQEPELTPTEKLSAIVAPIVADIVKTIPPDREAIRSVVQEEMAATAIEKPPAETIGKVEG